MGAKDLHGGTSVRKFGENDKYEPFTSVADCDVGQRRGDRISTMMFRGAYDAEAKWSQDTRTLQGKRGKHVIL